jgi:hypothetical protein
VAALKELNKDVLSGADHDQVLVGSKNPSALQAHRDRLEQLNNGFESAAC